MRCCSPFKLGIRIPKFEEIYVTSSSHKTGQWKWQDSDPKPRFSNTSVFPERCCQWKHSGLEDGNQVLRLPLTTFPDLPSCPCLHWIPFWNALCSSFNLSKAFLVFTPPWSFIPWRLSWPHEAHTALVFWCLIACCLGSFLGIFFYCCCCWFWANFTGVRMQSPSGHSWGSVTALCAVREYYLPLGPLHCLGCAVKLKLHSHLCVYFRWESGIFPFN